VASARTLQPQDQIAHYRIVGPIGAGGMGEVYLAQDQTLERSVALKILPPELVQSEERVRRFVREAKSASSLNHPNIVTIYEIGQDELRAPEGEGPREPDSSRLHYISMELVSGETLTTKIHHDKTDLRTLLSYLAQAAEGLAKAHAAGIVHRDLKPGNIMISKDGFAKVLDFGLAKLTEKTPAEGDVTSGPTRAGEGTSAGVLLGTVGYMSPEQVRGATVDHRSDIFSFGCILYEAATRTKPFMADSNVETMHKILHDKPIPVEELNKDVPTEVRRLIRRCLAKSPDQRFQSAKDLAIELREIVDEYDSLTASGSSGSGSSALSAPAPAGRRISPLMLIGGTALVMAVIIAGIFLVRGGGRSATPAAPPAIKISTVTNRGIANGAALSPDGRYLAYSLRLEGDRTLWVRQVATGSDVQILPPQKITPTGLTFTPDGNYLYYQSADPDRDGYTAVFEVPALGGIPRKRAYDVDSRVAFSPDGKQVCFRRGEPHKNRMVLVIRDLDGGQESVLASVSPPVTFGQPAWSPDGKKIAAIEVRGNAALSATVATYGVADGRREPLGKMAWFGANDLAWLPDGSGLVVSTFDQSGTGQLWKVTYPGGQGTPITNGTDVYFDISLSADAATIAAVRARQVLNLWTVSPAVPRAVRQVTFGSGDQGAVQTYDPAQDSTILYSAVKDGTSQVFSITAGGASERSLTTAQEFAGVPFFRPGVGIIYMQRAPDLTMHVWRADEHGENARQLTSGPGEQIVDVSPDGRLVLFNQDDNREVLWSVSSEGGKATQLGPSVQGSARFSPDGSRIGHVTIREVNGQGNFVPEIFQVNGGGTRISPALPPRAADAKWAPDGNGLTYSSAADDFRNLYLLRFDDGSAKVITRFSDGRISLHRWSPDGRRVLLLRQTGAGPTRNLWMTEADGTHPVALTDFQTGDITSMKWSRDGSRVYFLYGESSQSVVLVRNFQ
jgi:serine/threonine protein kinase/Tol biopolymer transport system component